MRKIIDIIILLSTLLVFLGCADKYDDNSLRKEIEIVDDALTEAERQIKQINSDLESVNALLTSDFISFITKDASGNFQISYKKPGDDTIYKLTLAMKSDAINSPILGAAQHTDGVYYWQFTPDNGATYEWLKDVDDSMVPVGGRVPVVGIDSDGYWTVDGVQVKDKEGEPVLGHDKSDSIFSDLEIDSDNAQAKFTLATGVVITIPMFESLTIGFDKPSVVAVESYAQPVVVEYKLYGTDGEEAFVDIFTAYNVVAVVDELTQTISIKLDNGAESGNIVVMAHANGNTVLKPLFFTYGAVEIGQPELDPNFNVGGEILMEGEGGAFYIKVSANIDYDIEIGGGAEKWLVKSTTRAPIVTTTHNFIVEYYEDLAGVVREGSITFSNRAYNISATVVVKQKPVQPEGEAGISTAMDLLAFATAVNNGIATSRWENEQGVVVLLNDIDMSGTTAWEPIGKMKPDKTLLHPFSGKFDGQNFKITNLNLTFDAENGTNIAHGLFGAVKDAEIRNVVLGKDGDEFTIVGNALGGTSVGSIAGYAENSKIEKVVNNVNISFKGEDGQTIQVMLGGIVGSMNGGVIGGDSPARGCENYGDVRSGNIVNTANGGTGMQVGGVCGYMQKNAANVIKYCENYGDVSAPTGRGGGLVGTCELGVISECANHGTVEDDYFGQHAGRASELTYNLKRMGGLVGGAASAEVTIEYCTNNGNVFSHLSCRTGGFVGHNNAKIVGCVNKGVILADLYTEANGTNKHGAGWACGYSAASSSSYINIRGCAKGGRVGNYTEHKNNPSGAPEATNDNALCHAPQNYDPSINN